jgi:hypothetical protein
MNLTLAGLLVADAEAILCQILFPHQKGM